MRLSRAILLEDINKALPQRLLSRYRPKKLVDELPAPLEQLELVGPIQSCGSAVLVLPPA